MQSPPTATVPSTAALQLAGERLFNVSQLPPAISSKHFCTLSAWYLTRPASTELGRVASASSKATLMSFRHSSPGLKMPYRSPAQLLNASQKAAAYLAGSSSIVTPPVGVLPLPVSVPPQAATRPNTNPNGTRRIKRMRPPSRSKSESDSPTNQRASTPRLREGYFAAGF